MSATTRTPPSLKNARRAAASGFLGGTIEFYDLALFGTAATLVFPALFFEPLGAIGSQMAALTVFGVAYIARPIGALLFGSWGDRVGRVRVLLIVLGLMGAATTGIGLLPTASTIGVWAGVILVCLRIVQGFSAGGELSGSATLTAELAPPNKRGLYTSWTMQGLSLGSLLALIAFAPISGDEQFLLDWGWRIPFLAAVPAVLIAMWVRGGVIEPPKEQQEAGKKATPLKSLFRFHWRSVVRIVFMQFYAVAGMVLTVISLAYGANTLKLDRPRLLSIVTAALVVALIAQPLWARLSDKVGRKPIFLFGTLSQLVMIPVLFWALSTGSWTFITIAFLVMGGTGASGTAVSVGFYAEMFPKSVRYSGTAFSAQASQILAGFFPAIAIGLQNPADPAFGWVPIAIAAAVMMIVAIIATLTVRETANTVLAPPIPDVSESSTVDLGTKR